jgi:integrase
MSQEKLRLRLYKHPRSGIWQIRGTYLGRNLDESAGTRNERDAEGILERRKRDIYEEVVLNKPRPRSFAEAMIGYVKAGGEKTFLAKINAAEIKVDGAKRIFGQMLLTEIDQSVIDDLAAAIYPNAKDATRNRQLYTPVSAVLQYAADQTSWGFTKGRIRRPPTPLGRVDWRTPKEIQWWLDNAGPEKAIITGYVGTGARAGELIKLDWPQVSPANHRFTLWEGDTKAGRARGIDEQTRVRGLLPQRPADGLGPVYLNGRGERWTVGAVQKALDRITVRAVRERANNDESERIAELVHRAGSAKFDHDARNEARKQVWAIYEAIAERERVAWIHPHVFRHTWATWTYAVTRDLAWLMDQGGWAKPAMAMRYTHVGSADLADEVLSYGWEMRPGLNARPLSLPGPAPEKSDVA